MILLPCLLSLRRGALAAVIALSFAVTAVAAESAKVVRLLTIGNSFANDATRHLPGLAEAGGRELEIFRANLGGHSLQQHAGYLLAYEADPTDPKGSPYPNHFVPNPADAPKLSLRQILDLREWDYITIQQVSIQNFVADSFEPHAATLVAYLREHEPQAEILVHQTWAYREDSPLFREGKVDQAGMHARLQANYRALAARYGLRILPVGDAFNAARQTPRWRFRFPDPAFDYTAPTHPNLPDQTGSLNIGWVWRKDAQSPEHTLRLDANHANVAGQYLGAAVFYQGLFGEDVSAVDYVPPGLAPDAAASLRAIAAETVAREKHVRR